MNHPNGPILAGKVVTTALFWPREEEGALNMSSTAEHGKGGGADQANMQLLGLTKDKKQCMLYRLRFNCFGKSMDYRTAISISALIS